MKKLDPFLNKINSLDKMQQILIFIGTMVVICALYFWLLYMPKNNEIKRLETKSKTLKTQVLTAKRKAFKLNKLRAELENRKGEYLEVMKALPDTKEIPGILSSLSASAKDSGLKLFNITPDPEVDKGFYAEIPISVKLDGRYHEIAVFFDRVSRFNRIINIKDVKMSLGGKDQIIASCKAVTYRFLKEKDKVKNKEKKS